MCVSSSLARSALAVALLGWLAATVSVGPAIAQPPFEVDHSFGNRGTVTGVVGPVSSSATLSPKALAVDGSGRMIVGAASGSKWTVWRILRSGELDPAFGNHGSVEVSSWGPSSNPARVNLAAAAVRPDGRILLVGYRGGALNGDQRFETAYMIMKQLLREGSPDSSFGVDGGKTAGAKRGATSVAFRSNGGFLVAGFKQYSPTGPTDDAVLFSFSESGRIERNFGPGENVDGVSILGAPRQPSVFFDVELLDNGRILAAGIIKDRLFVVKFLADGTFDRSFGQGGRVVFLPDRKASWAAARDLELDRRGRILVAGYASPKDPESSAGYGLVIRLRNNGRLDRTFASKGVARVYATPRRGYRSTRLYDLAIDEKGGIWTAGSAGQAARSERHAIVVRRLSDGRKDSKFFKNGLLSLTVGEASVGTSTIRSGRKMTVAGRFDLGDEERFFVKKFESAP